MSVDGTANIANAPAAAAAITKSTNFMAVTLGSAENPDRPRSTGRYRDNSIAIRRGDGDLTSGANCTQQGPGFPGPLATNRLPLPEELLLCRHVVRRAIVQLVVIRNRYGLAVLADRLPYCPYDLAVAL